MRKIQGTTLRLFGMALVTVISMTGCGKGCGKEGGSTSKSSLELIPADSNVLVGLNWKKVQGSPLGGKIKEGMPKEAEAILKDVDGVLLGGNLKGLDQSKPDFVAVISGKLDSAAILNQIAEQAKAQGVASASEDYEGIKITSLPKDADMGIAFIGDQGVIGSKVGIKKAIDLSKKKGDSVEKNKDLIALIQNVDQGKMLWAVGSVPPGMIPAGAGEGGPGNPMAALSNLKAIDLAVDFGDNLIIDLGVLTPTKENAQQLVTMANTYKTLFGTSLASKDPSIGKVLNGLNIGAKDDRVLLSLKLDKATVEELSKKTGESAPMPGGPGPDAMMPPPGMPSGEAAMPPPPAPPVQ